MVDSPDEIVSFAEVVLVGNSGEEFAEIVQRLAPQQHVIDLVRLKAPRAAHYEGIAW